jgi:hypothetical protein
MKIPNITNSMGQSPFREANSLPVEQEITRLLGYPKVHCHVHKIPATWYYSELVKSSLQGLCDIACEFYSEKCLALLPNPKMKDHSHRLPAKVMQRFIGVNSYNSAEDVNTVSWVDEFTDMEEGFRELIWNENVHYFASWCIFCIRKQTMFLLFTLTTCFGRERP